MPNLVDFIERATTGPILAEDTFNLKVLIPNVSKLVQEYDIRYDPETPVCADDDVADRLFAAAVEFVAQTGVYCDATNRVIGVDNPVLEFIEQAGKARADVIALSSLMTTTMPAQREVIETLEEMGLRDRYVVIVGGGPVNQEWADEIDADGYGETAIHAVELVQRLLSVKK